MLNICYNHKSTIQYAIPHSIKLYVIFPFSSDRTDEKLQPSFFVYILQNIIHKFKLIQLINKFDTINNTLILFK